MKKEMFLVHKEFLINHYDYRYLKKDMFIKEYNAFVENIDKEYVKLRKV